MKTPHGFGAFVATGCTTWSLFSMLHAKGASASLVDAFAALARNEPSA